MASVKKFSEAEVINQLRHIERTIYNPTNEDIDMDKTPLNYSLSPQREVSSFNYYKHRKSELHCMNRKDVKTMAGWIITAPADLSANEHNFFFSSCYDFLKNRYGEKNVIQAIVHGDESGQPHLHFCFIPATSDIKHGGEKICAKEILNRTELQNFHPALQKHLTEHGINVNIMSGITKAQGGNRTVSELKKERSLNIEKQRNTERNYGRW